MVRMLRVRSAIPLFGRVLHHSSMPTNLCSAVAWSGSPGRPEGRREAAYPGRARARRHACTCLRGACALSRRCLWR